MTPLVRTEPVVLPLGKSPVIRRVAAPLNPHITLTQAETLRRTSNPDDFGQSILTESEFTGITLPERAFILRNLLIEETMCIVNGFRGSGKSWFALSLVNEVSWGGKFGPWQVDTPCNCLLIDGEMPLSLLKERLVLLNSGRDVRDKPASLFIYPEAYAYRIGLHRANILCPRWRDEVADVIRSLRVRVLVLDNLSSLAPGIDENDKMPFDPVNRWMLELRFHGVAIVMTHHTGKSGEQRGTSAHEDHVDLALQLSKPKGYRKDDGCKFDLMATKDRAYVMRDEEYMMMLDNVDGRMQFTWTIPDRGKSQSVRLNPNMSYKDAAKAGISHRTYYRAKRSKT